MIRVEGGEFNIQGGSFACDKKPIVSLKATKDTDKSEFVLSGGTLLTGEAPVIKDNITSGNISVKVDADKGSMTSLIDNAVYLKNDSPGTVKLEVNKGNISGKKNGILAEKGVNVEINGGNIFGSSVDGVAVVNGSKAVVNGGVIKGLWSGLYAESSKININGGDFLGMTNRRQIGRASCRERV